MIAIDASYNKRTGITVYSIVGTTADKLRLLTEKASWAKEARKLSKQRKKSYLAAFPRRYQRLLRENLVELSRTTTSLDEVNDALSSIEAEAVIVDDAIYDKVSTPHKIKESRVKARDRRTLMLLADNLANYVRRLLETKPDKARQEARKLWKP